MELGVGEGEIKSFLLPVTTQNHPLFNPDMDYSVYLTHPFFFVFLQVLMPLVAKGNSVPLLSGCRLPAGIC